MDDNEHDSRTDDAPREAVDAEAEPEAVGFDGEPPPLPLGPPFAFSDVKLLDRAQGSDGCFASVVCDVCDQPFRINLLTSGYKVCPTDGCGTRFTTCLMVGHDDNDSLFADMVGQVLQANGIATVADDDDDDDEDDDE
jgi:hypothetical protein